jgi:hypothetical protein
MILFKLGENIIDIKKCKKVMQGKSGGLILDNTIIKPMFNNNIFLVSKYFPVLILYK